MVPEIWNTRADVIVTHVLRVSVAYVKSSIESGLLCVSEGEILLHARVLQ